MPTQPRDFEFNFEWDGTMQGSVKGQGLEHCLSSAHWNFSNLDRSDRIHMVYNTLYDSRSKLPASQSGDKSTKNRQGKKRDQYVTAVD